MAPKRKSEREELGTDTVEAQAAEQVRGYSRPMRGVLGSRAGVLEVALITLCASGHPPGLGGGSFDEHTKSKQRETPPCGRRGAGAVAAAADSDSDVVELLDATDGDPELQQALLLSLQEYQSPSMQQQQPEQQQPEQQPPPPPPPPPPQQQQPEQPSSNGRRSNSSSGRHRRRRAGQCVAKGTPMQQARLDAKTEAEEPQQPSRRQPVQREQRAHAGAQEQQRQQQPAKQPQQPPAERRSPAAAAKAPARDKGGPRGKKPKKLPAFNPTPEQVDACFATLAAGGSAITVHTLEEVRAA